MSQAVSNVSSNSALGGLWTGSAGSAGSTAKSSGTQGMDSAFGLTLSTLIGGEAAAQGGLAAQLTLLSLANSSEKAENPAEVDLAGLLEGVVAQLEEADKESAYSEELLDMLQGWLQSAISFLNHASNQEAEQNASNGALLTLAQQPQTIRFAIQDVMMQLAQSSSGTHQQQLTNVTSQQAASILESLQAILTNAGLSAEKVTADRTRLAAGSEFAGKLASESGLANQDAKGLQTNGTTNQRLAADSLKAVTETVPLQVVQQPQAEEANPTVSSKQAVTDSSQTETDGWIQPGTIVTAGQLALRDHPAAALKIPATQVPVEKFSDEVGKFIVHKLDIIKAGGVSEARISLYPEHLGQVDVKITMQNGHMVAQFVTEHLFAKESLEGQMAQLRSALQSQGLQVNKLEVVTQNVGLSSHMYQDGRQQGSSSNLNQQHSDRRRDEVREEDYLSVQDLNEEWTEWMTEVRTRDAGLGSSFVARV